MGDYSYGQAYADAQAELRESAARASAARREARQRKGASGGVPGSRVLPWWRALGWFSALGRRARRITPEAGSVSTSGYRRKMTRPGVCREGTEVVHFS